MIRRPPRSTQGVSSAASDVYKRQQPALGGFCTNRHFGRFPRCKRTGQVFAPLIRAQSGSAPIVGGPGIVRNAESWWAGFVKADDRAVLASRFPRSRNRVVNFCEQPLRRAPDCWARTNSWWWRDCPQCGVRALSARAHRKPGVLSWSNRGVVCSGCLTQRPSCHDHKGDGRNNQDHRR